MEPRTPSSGVFCFRRVSSSCRASSMPPVREDRRRIRMAPRAPRTAMHSWPIRRIPRVAFRAFWCGTSGTRPSLSRTRAPRTGDGIPCRCIRRWAWGLSFNIRIDQWGVRKFQNRGPLVHPILGSNGLPFAPGGGWAAVTCRRSRLFSCRAGFTCPLRKNGWSKSLPECKFAAGAIGSRRIESRHSL